MTDKSDQNAGKGRKPDRPRGAEAYLAAKSDTPAAPGRPGAEQSRRARNERIYKAAHALRQNSCSVIKSRSH